MQMHPGTRKFHCTDDMNTGTRKTVFSIHAHENSLKGLHGKFFADYAQLRQNQFSYRKALYSYLKEAEKMQVPSEEALSFHKKSVYSEAKALRASCTGGQAPGVIIFANTSEDFSFVIFSEGIQRVDEKNRLVGGAFGGAINVRKPRHLGQTSDFISSAYMNGHMVDKDACVPYEPIVCSCGNGFSDGMTEKDSIALAAQRRDKFIGDWKKAGFMVFDKTENTPYRVTFTNGELAKTYIPIVLHDLRDCRYYVIEGENKIPFEEWVGTEGLAELPIVKSHLGNLSGHRAEAAYFEELVGMVRRRKGLYCVDSRHQRQDSSAIKDLGAIATEEQRERILDTPSLKELTVCLHFGCGYLQTAMEIHEAGMELKRAFDKGRSLWGEAEVKAVRSEFEARIREVLEDRWNGFDTEAFCRIVDRLQGKPLSSETTAFLNKLFHSELSDTRNTAQHMVERGMLAWSRELGTVAMPSALETDEYLGSDSNLLPQNRSKDPETAKRERQAYFDRITLVAARRQKERWEATAIARGKDIAVNVHIEDFCNGQIVATIDGRSAYDAVTGEEVLLKMA